jgi:hypothetical protein
MTSPFYTYAGLLERSTHLIHMYLRDEPEVLGYQFWGHRTINDAYGDPLNSGVGGAGPVALFEVARGNSYRSPVLRRKKLGMVEESRRGTTHAIFDVEDFIAPAVGGSPIPPDGGWMFLRVQEQRAAGLLQNLGVAEAEVTLTAVGAGDELVIKGLIFQFQAGANVLAGRTGAPANEFVVGLGADDNAAAANLILALNDAGDVGPALDLVAPLNLHTFGSAGTALNQVVIQPEDGTPSLVPGATGQLTATTADAPRVALDAASTAAGTLVASLNAADPVLGPIYCIPPVDFFGSYEPTFTAQGIAPSSTASAEGNPPDLDQDLTSAAPRAMYLVFPKPLTALSIRNLSLVNLLVSFGPGQTMRRVDAGAILDIYSGSTKEVLLACPDGVAGAAFSLHGVVSGEAS